MHDFLKFHHNCDVYMGVQKKRKSTFLTAFEHREESLSACLLHNIFIAVASECFCHLGAQYPVPALDFYHSCFSNRVTVLFALLALHIIRTVLLQLKIFPCDSAQAWHTDKSSLRNISENEKFSELIKMQNERSGQSKNFYSHTHTWFYTQLVL